ncbi:hypothetical protein FOA52_002562 [Chlamydomonas sp. UWO 241]|nr:hypothetical protein FOA52_002562 [Chlamydomonas sp. UWO 241]
MRSSWSPLDHFRTLGLSSDASSDDIKKAFRKAALEHHPDRHSGASDNHRAEASLRFKAVSEAYEVLSDDRKRATYRATTSSGGSGQAGYHAGSYYTSSAAYRNVNPDYGASRSSYDYGRTYEYHARPSFWRRFERAFGSAGMRRAELAFGAVVTVAAVSIFFFTDDVIKYRNRGRGFEEMQLRLAADKAAARAAQAQSAHFISAGHGGGGTTGGTAGGTTGEAAGGTTGGTTGRTAAAAGGSGVVSARALSPRRRLGPQPSSEEAQMADMSLTDLIALEERVQLQVAAKTALAKLKLEPAPPGSAQQLQPAPAQQ